MIAQYFLSLDPFLLTSQSPDTILPYRYSFLYITLVPKAPRKKTRTAEFPIRLRGHIWIEGQDGTFLGYGRVALLKSIREHASISQAAKELGISYRRAWIMVNSMNSQLPQPFVETATGGKKGGGTRVTHAGENAIKEFWRVHRAFGRFLEREDLRLNTRLHMERKPKRR